MCPFRAMGSPQSTVFSDLNQKPGGEKVHIGFKLGKFSIFTFTEGLALS